MSASNRSRMSANRAGDVFGFIILLKRVKQVAE